MSDHHDTTHSGMADQPDMPEELRPDPADVARLLAALDAIPRTELPDGKARDVLAHQIRLGHVIAFSQRTDATTGRLAHVIEWGDFPAWIDPHQHVTVWLAASNRLMGGEAE